MTAILAAGLIRTLRATMRIRHVGREALDILDRENGGYILAFWHGRLLMMPWIYRRRRMAILISRHSDGELIARTMARFGHHALRGSSTRGGAAALRQVVQWLRQGGDVGITPDGPRGPRFRVQPGVVQAARLSGAPIVPVSFSARPARRLSSWDRFLVPMPFARGVLACGAPLSVPRRATPAEQEQARREIERRLRDLTARIDGEPLDDAVPDSLDAGDSGQ